MLGRVENQSGLWSKVTMHIEILLLKHAKKKIITCTFESLILDFIWKKLSGSRRCDLTDILQRSGDGLWSGGACSKFQNLNPIFNDWVVTTDQSQDSKLLISSSLLGRPWCCVCWLRWWICGNVWWQAQLWKRLESPSR